MTDMPAKHHVLDSPVGASALRQRVGDALVDLSAGSATNVVNGSGDPAPRLSNTYIDALNGTNFNQSLVSFIGGTVGAGHSWNYGVYVNANHPVNAAQTQMRQSRSEAVGCAHDIGLETNWQASVEVSSETPEHKAQKCRRCGGRLKRLHRSLLQRLLYRKVYRCQECLIQEVRL